MAKTPTPPDNLGDQVKKVLTDAIFVIPKNSEQFSDAEFSVETDAIIDKLVELFTKLNLVLNYTDQNKLGEKKREISHILWQGANSLVSSLQLIRQGYFMEPNVINRHSLEYLAMGLAINDSKEYYEKYQKGKLFGYNCFTKAKAIVPTIGEAYGQLSLIAHPSNKFIGSHINELDGVIIFSIGGALSKENTSKTRFALSILGIIAQSYIAGVEFMFIDFLSETSVWLRSGNVLEWKPNDDQIVFSRLLMKNLEKGLGEIQKQ